MPLDRCNDAESGTFTRAFVPLKTSASPNLPVLVQVAFETVPVFAFPDESATLVPDPSSNPYAATKPGPEVPPCVVAVAMFENGPRLLAASVARTR
jgi:hypothetical protein